MITAQDVYDALKKQQEDMLDYVENDPVGLHGVIVDGLVNCESMAEFLNERHQRIR